MLYITSDEIVAARATLRAEGRRLALTNGVFDLLHTGHLRYLTAAAALADVLWVAVNSDASVRRLKGPNRPLVPWAERAELLAALRPVAAVLLLDDLTADTLIQLVQPDIYVKGGDYTLETLPETPTAQAVGAEIHLIPFTPERSTSLLIEAIMKNYSELNP